MSSIYTSTTTCVDSLSDSLSCSLSEQEEATGLTQEKLREHLMWLMSILSHAKSADDISLVCSLRCTTDEFPETEPILKIQYVSRMHQVGFMEQITAIAEKAKVWPTCVMRE